MDEPGWSPDNNESTIPDGTKKKRGNSDPQTRRGRAKQCRKNNGKPPSLSKSAFALALECPLTYHFTAHFKDLNPNGGREYMCVPIESEFHKYFESYNDFSKNVETMDSILTRRTHLALQPTKRKRETFGPQLFIVKLGKGAETLWNAIDDNGAIEMVHLTSGRICQGYYDMHIQHSDPPRTKRGFILFQVFVLTDKSI